ncbi:MAG TPA: M4 family metallopeptidase, partial [Pyrinomonadaceae bacterium]|nr:M4 family metallopeptidase [Pyrinomonadaceae bacterium]
IFPATDSRTHLAYRVRMRREDGTRETAMPVIFIDAQTGEKIFEYDNLQTATGSSLYSGAVAIDTSSVGSTYYMEDLSRKIGTFDARNGTSTFYRLTDADDVWDISSQRAAVDAHYGAMKTFDYFKIVHGRNGIDGAGGPGTQTAAADASIKLLSSRVHYSYNYVNAYWNGSTMTYGDGDGTTAGPLVALDICAHEMTHGITERTAGLIYSGESGALNESMSDVFGAMVERYARGENTNTWLIGEDAWTPAKSGDALRYMNNPHYADNGGYSVDDDPDHYSERYTGTGDNGGVHINSGIANHAFYLLAKGGAHHKGGSMNGIGADAAAKIWYKALTTYMTSSTNFAGARIATINAASALYGSTSAQSNAVAQAWCLVGVSGSNCPTPGGGTGTGTEILSNGGFETSAAPWVGSGAGYFYVNPGSHAHAGTGYIYFGVNHSVSGQAYQQVTIPTAAAGALTFWLSVSSSETSTTTQYDKLFVEVRNASGALLATLATYSNLNKGTAGVYAQKSLNLSAYRGQTVRIQFRSTTDNTLSTTFLVDDVALK